MRIDAFDFDLPADRVALHPARPRDSARLLFAPPGRIEDRIVRDLPEILHPGDLLVVNDTRVMPAALEGLRDGRGGGEPVRVEINLHKRVSPSVWRAFARPAKRLREGDVIRFGAGLAARVTARSDGGETELAFDRQGSDLDAAVAAVGAMPLPPYILAQRDRAAEDADDYQTMFAARTGAVAAPTAGLHFTPALMRRLEERGVERAALTLHVGAGTFLPVKVDDTAGHRMHAEWREIPSAAAEAINRARQERRRVIAVGTTVMRSLESAIDASGRVEAAVGETDIFITPGFRFRVVDALWTNFHLPRSTLFMLVAAFVGLERAHALYAHAIAQGYRFYSYGDASLLFREAT
jgi:S-adenosylmethionine:tRNA ribosyltransferase-isomerase